jgi:hypothetical protein
MMINCSTIPSVIDNIVEGFNKIPDQVSSKDRTYGQTIENRRRTMLAADLQSVDSTTSNEFFHLPELRVTTISLFLFCDPRTRKIVAEDAPKMETVKITRMRTLEAEG